MFRRKSFKELVLQNQPMILDQRVKGRVQVKIYKDKRFRNDRQMEIQNSNIDENIGNEIASNSNTNS